MGHLGLEYFAKKILSSSTMKGFSTTSLMRIMALLGDIMGDSLHINRDKIETSHELMEILGFEILVGARGMSR